MTTHVVLFTRDLRLTDNPSLAAAHAQADFVVPLFVRDPAADRSEMRSRFLADCLHDLDEALRTLGARLVVRSGHTVEQVVRVAEEVDATVVHVAGDVSLFARRREERLAAELAANRRELQVHRQVHTVVEPGTLRPAGADHYSVFTPYWRRWSDTDPRPLATKPRRLQLPKIGSDRLPGRDPVSRFPGGEGEGRRRMNAWLAGGVSDYANQHDQLAADGTSRLSPYLHFGCVSATELLVRAGERGADEFCRQLAWRDFYHQVLAHDPRLTWRDYRSRPDGQLPFGDDKALIEIWRAGQTGYPLVDAGMRQLRSEGWMHNRARMMTASFLTKTLGQDWRAGAAVFFDQLLDGDVANNTMNWQWVAGTGNDTRPNRRLSPIRQAERFDGDARYIKRWVEELAELPAEAAREPWRLEAAARPSGYPAPIIDPPGSGRR